MGVGASAGGLEALSTLLASLPSSLGMAVLIVQHLDPRQESVLGEILARRTAMTVRTATNGAEIERDHVYVIPPNTTMSVASGRIVLSARDGDAIPMPIDVLFCSLATGCGANAVGVVLSLIHI